MSRSSTAPATGTAPGSEFDKELKEAFSIFDRNGDGNISKDELKIVLEALGQTVTDMELEALLLEIDEDNDGEINYDEFRAMMEFQMKVQNTESDVEKAFAIFDPNATGYINSDELLSVFTTMGNPLSAEEVQSVLKEAKPDSKGRIKFKQFVHLMCS